MPRPNILLVMTDSQRYETVGANGNRFAQTPTLDSLAAEGTRFERAYINGPACIPSRACVQTGRYTHQHGRRHAEIQITKTPGLPPWELTFMERLQWGGYETGCTGKNDMNPAKGYDVTHITRGKGARWKVAHGSEYGPSPLGDDYAQWLEQRLPGGYERIYEQRRSAEYAAQSGLVEHVLPFELTPDYWVMEKSVDFVRQQRNTPFFLSCNFLSPHGPYDPPAPYSTMYDPADMVISPLFVGRGDRVQAEATQRRRLALYYGMVSMVDDLFGRIVKALKDTNQWENTLVIFTTDHGVMLGDYGQLGKSNFYEAVIRAPFFVKLPGEPQGPQTVSELIELIDIAPTILDYAGMRIPTTMEGVSLRSLLEGKGGGKEAVLCEVANHDQTRLGKCLRTARYKYWHFTNGDHALFDLEEDPLERNNLIDQPAYQGVRLEMMERLLNRLFESERPLWSLY